MSENAESVGEVKHEDLSPNSALLWLPAMAEVAARHDGIHFPKSCSVSIEFEDAANWIDGHDSGFNFDGIREKAESIGYPVFVRTDITSAKHQGLAGIRARDAEELRTAVRLAIEANAMQMGTPRPNAIVIRDWIDLAVGFYDDAKITDSKRQIAREFRMFASPGEVLCTHFYWPAASINGGIDDERQHKLADMAILVGDEREKLERYAADLADHISPQAVWSVDFAVSEDGDWYAIDMALGDLSWHPESCPQKEPIESGDVDV